MPIDIHGRFYSFDGHGLNTYNDCLRWERRIQLRKLELTPDARRAILNDWPAIAANYRAIQAIMALDGVGKLREFGLPADTVGAILDDWPAIHGTHRIIQAIMTWDGKGKPPLKRAAIKRLLTPAPPPPDDQAVAATPL